MNNLSKRLQNKNFGKNVKAHHLQRARINEVNYYKNPKHCAQCDDVLPYRSYKKFCNSSCAASFNNKKRLPPTVETNNKRRQSLLLYYDKNVKCGNGRNPHQPKFSVIQFSTCSLCHSSFYVRHNKNIKTNMCLNCKQSDFTLISTNICKVCDIAFVSKHYQKYCSSCSPNIRHYRTRAGFKFNIFEYPEEFDLYLIEKHGWYSPNGYKCRNKKPNLMGVSRDHLYSVHDGFINNVNPNILAHPANCKIILHGVNNKKNSKSSITLKQLEHNIKLWDSIHI